MALMLKSPPEGRYVLTPHYLDASEDDPDEELLPTIVLTFERLA
jgi:hypothetical protein